MTPIYLASPYSHPEARMRYWRFLSAIAAATELARRGFAVYSPIVASYPIELVIGLEAEDFDHEFWMEYNDAWLQRSEQLVILKLEGWEQSKGVAHERQRFAELFPDAPITEMEPVKLPAILQNWQMPYDAV